MALPRRLSSWLLDKAADPSVRLRVLTEILGRPEGDREVVAARREIGRTGWAASILDEQLAGGQWATRGTTDRDLYRPKYIATNWRLLVLSDLGASGADPRVARALRLFVRRFGGPRGGLGGRDSEVCFTGNAARLLLKLRGPDDPDAARCLTWLLRHQKADGGWHCFPSRTGTLDGWEALAAFAQVPPDARSPAMRRSIERGAEFYLARGLLREGRRPYAPWERFHYPVHYYYDLLVGLDVLTSLGYGSDRRMREPLDRLEARRDRDGRWALDAVHPDMEDPNYRVRTPVYPFVLELPGRPSRWITTTALVVLRRAGRQ